MASGVVSDSQTDEERTLTGTQFGSALGSEGVSSSEYASCLESAHSTRLNEAIASDFGSQGATLPIVPTQNASFDEARVHNLL